MASTQFLLKFGSFWSFFYLNDFEHFIFSNYWYTKKAILVESLSGRYFFLKLMAVMVYVALKTNSPKVQSSQVSYCFNYLIGHFLTNSSQSWCLFCLKTTRHKNCYMRKPIKSIRLRSMVECLLGIFHKLQFIYLTF